MKQGFTLIEMLVAVGIFTVVMVIALGALLSVSESDRKAQTIKTITNNLGFALEGMSRAIRTGIDYSCGSWNPGQDCTSGSGGSLLTFQDVDGLEVGFQRSTNAALCGQSSEGGVGCIVRSRDGGVTWEPITASEVIVEHLSFYLLGSSRSDSVQPRVTISMRGFIPITGGATTRTDCNTAGITCSTFDLQTTVTQRLYDQ
jgi:prepilin-type N-terminal cleavage/methylation domain-containing protein